MRNYRHILAFLAVAFLLVIVTGCKNDSPTLQINDIASDPAAFEGALTVVGIVNAYAQSDASMVGVMDKKELQCTTPDCNKVLLPVKFTGSRPAIGDEVKISGSFSRESGGYLFRAEKMEVLGNHNLGGQG